MKNPREFGEFRHSINTEFSQYLLDESVRFNPKECLKIDLHCHDKNSDVPDELWGRLLRLPETWLKTKKLVKRLRKNNCDVITVTNHNNARSCWELQEAGEDVLPAAEFTCYFDEYNLFLHVLAYGFTQQQEQVLNEKRQDIFEFLRFCARYDIPVILPHPLYFYTANEKIDLRLFEKLAVMFQRFEVLNGQRDLWQSVLTLNWTRSLTPEKVREYAAKHDLNPCEFGVDPDQPKVLTGGSDDHMGVFAGDSGSLLWVPNLAERLKTEKPSQLTLDAIRKGRISPYGHVAENQKLNIALLDYFSQVATNIEDPGLLRMVMHRGEIEDKVMCFFIANFLLELQKHKNANKFFKFVHDALQGKKPSKLVKWQVPSHYNICIEQLEKIADSTDKPPREFVATVNDAITAIFTDMNKLIIQRLEKHMLQAGTDELSLSPEDIARKFEVPSQVSALLKGNNTNKGMSNFDVGKLVDDLSFPLLISGILMGATVASTRVLYKNRQLLNDFSDYIGKSRHQRRALHLTDTLQDKNGVSKSLSGKLKNAQEMDLPIDFLVCGENIASEDNLHVVKPLTCFKVPGYSEQEIRIPDLMQIAKIFYEGGYDRIVCSTEGPMALVAIVLKFMFNVPTYFFMHTDWVAFAKDTAALNKHEQDRVRRLLRSLYQQFDGVFALNSDHKEWLSGYEMELPEESVYLTSHQAPQRQTDVLPIDKSELFADADENTPILFLACRLSQEKGVFELPEIMAKVQREIPDIRLVVAGCGPAEEALKQALPDALFLGWVDSERLAQLYAGLDLFVFPSKFDTFGNVILEAFVHGMPVVSYNCKGPKDIIEHGCSGYLAESVNDMADHIVDYFGDQNKQVAMAAGAVNRAGDYCAETIMGQFLSDIGLSLQDDNAVKHDAAVTDEEVKVANCREVA